MKTQWKQVPSHSMSHTRYKGLNERAKAWVQRSDHGSYPS